METPSHELLVLLLRGNLIAIVFAKSRTRNKIEIMFRCSFDCFFTYSLAENESKNSTSV